MRTKVQISTIAFLILPLFSCANPWPVAREGELDGSASEDADLTDAEFEDSDVQFDADRVARDADIDTDVDREQPVEPLRPLECPERRIEGPIEVSSPDDLERLRDITHLNGDLIISDASIENLDTLACLREIQGSFELEHNDRLTSVVGLRSLERIGGNLELESSPLETLRGLDNLRVVNGTLTIILPDLHTLAALNRLETLEGSLKLSYLASLPSIDGFIRLDRIGGQLSINFNDHLLHLDGFRSLERIEDALSIRWNDTLNTLSGLRNLRFVGRRIQIGENPRLPTCDAERLRDILVSRGHDQFLSIYQNNDDLDCDVDNPW